MPGETIHHDEAVGGLAWKSKVDLADELIHKYLDYEHESVLMAPAEELIPSGGYLNSIGNFRFGTLSPPYRDSSSRHLTDGYAFCVAPHESHDPAYMTGTYFRIARGDTPEVAESKSIFIARPDTLQGMLAEQEETEELARALLKPELEVVTRILGKMAQSLRLARMIINFDDSCVDLETGRPTVSKGSFIKLDMEADLNKLANPDPVILCALQDYNLPELNKLFPANQPIRSPAMETDQLAGIRPEHISEWPEFTSAIESRFRRETDTGLKGSALAIQHLAGDDHYFMRFRMQTGELSRIQLLCWDQNDHWLVQEFDLTVTKQEDDLARLKIRPEWDRAVLLEAVKYGQPITNEIYKGYLEIAACDPDSELSAGEVIDLRVNKKRPAA